MPLAWWRDTRSLLRSKGVRGGFSLEGGCFEGKIVDFSLKKHPASEETFPRTPFERSDERIPRHQAKGMGNSA